ncbi:MAG: nucleotidyltransferase domain-containing protein [Candidatus Nanopelagicales bacterium]|nr:nucleotidyltransferase domain-containing protein [Candidatus Nanopelagicales bacterium]
MRSEVEERLRAELREAARASAELHRQSRSLLVGAVRKGAAAGLSQRQIAECVGRSQPEVARLLRFQPTSARGRAVAAKRGEILRIAQGAGFSDVRIFGSVARGEDGPESDVDLLVTAPTDVSLLDLARLERSLSEVVGEKVEIVPDSGLRSNVRETAMAEAIPL